jgi:hypothetical protein
VSKTTSNFTGGISNTGTISGGQAGILLSAATFAGGIDNSGAIFAGSAGLAVGGLRFAGGIRNGGTIVSTNTGILVALSVFSGGINNTGTISGAGPAGIFLGGKTFSGGITNTGDILATGTSDVGIEIATSIFTGGISNFGVIAGPNGIAIDTARPVSIFNAGAILASGGEAIQFAGSGNTLTLAAGYTISGTVDPSGHNTFALGGTGSGTFDLSLIGTQFKGFTTFDVVGGTWTVKPRQWLEYQRRRYGRCQRHRSLQDDGERGRRSACRSRRFRQQRDRHGWRDGTL